MRYVFYLILGIVLIGLQTAILSGLPNFFPFYDILIPFVVYFSLFRGLPAGLVVVLVIGFLMDMVSGAPNGVYMAAFMLVFLMFRNITAYFHAGEAVLFTVCTAVGVVVESLIVDGVLMLSEMTTHFYARAFHTLIAQLVWVLLTAPMVYRLLAYVFAGVDHLRNRPEKI
ncbi:MAG: rod shape-determining protein MreD [Desulfobacterales bacterium]|nr:rod shape-determining protein MreD [Desulfobacterales bacterium]